MADPYDLNRFVKAQDPVFDKVREELRSGRKASHWMWFVFPQMEGLGHSPTSKEFAIRSRAEADAYLNDPVLGSRLRECTQLVTRIPEGIGIEEIFSYPDYLKFHSCMTLFAQVAPENRMFKDALQRYFEGRPDSATLDRL
jgi:uncharacterized protein (DUF1810 family)